MSKSLGNFTTIADVLKDWSGEVARLNMLRTHYRQPIDWTIKSLEESKSILQSFNDETDQATASAPPQDFVDCLTDDLNISTGLAVLHSLKKAGRIAELKAALNLLGFSGKSDAKKISTLSRDQIVRLVEDRLLARHQKNWAESDRLRDELDALGIAIKDNKDGTTTWDVKQ